MPGERLPEETARERVAVIADEDGWPRSLKIDSPGLLGCTTLSGGRWRRDPGRVRLMLLEVATAPLRDGRRVIVHVSGQVDLSSVEYLRDALRAAAAPRRAIVVDLAHVTFFSAAGVRCLEQFDDVVSSLCGQFALVFAGDFHPVYVVLCAVGMVDRWPIHQSVDAAQVIVAEQVPARGGAGFGDPVGAHHQPTSPRPVHGGA